MAAQHTIHPPEDALRAFALGKLDQTASSALMNHLDDCPDCCKKVAALSGDDFLNRLRQAQGRSCTPAPAQSLAASLGASQPLNLVRPEVPEELAAVVRKMMAKPQAKRYQTPLEVVQALVPFVKPASGVASAPRVPPSPELSSGAMEAKPSIKKPAHVDPPPVAAPVKKPSEPADVWGSLTEDSIASVAPRKRRAATVRERSSTKKWLLGGGIVMGVLLLALGVFKVKTKDGIIVLEVDQPGAEVVVDEGKITVHVSGDDQPIEIKVEPGEHKLRISKKDFVAVTKEIESLFPKWVYSVVPRLTQPWHTGKTMCATAVSAVGTTSGTDSELAAGKSPPIKVKLIPVTVAEPNKEPYLNSLGMKFRLIPAGKFIMGSSPGEIERCINLKLPWPPAEQFESEGPGHEVEITKPFYIGIHEVTVGQFRQFVKAMDYKTQAEKEGGAFSNFPDGEWKIDGDTNWRNPGFEQTDDHPVVCISWNDAVAFCTWLSGKEGRTYRLPTEAEWEYCCRAKTTTRFCCGDDITRLKEFVNLADESLKKKFPPFPLRNISWDDGYPFTAPVGQFQANDFGLHDMHGNAFEWCADWYDKEYYKNSPTQDPPGPNSAVERVARGGAWKHEPVLCRSTFRGYSGAVTQAFGFRVVLLPEKRAAKADAPPTEQAPKFRKVERSRS